MPDTPETKDLHAAADDGAPVCSSMLLLIGAQSTSIDEEVTCWICLAALARPHRGPVRRELEVAR